MRDLFQILVLLIIGVALLWFGYTLLIGQWAEIRKHRKSPARLQKATIGSPGDPQVCPICSSKLQRGDLVQTHAFPSITGGKDRLMHIRGCMYCINGKLQRKCPVCGASLSISDMLISRMFDRSLNRSHVHIIGCNKCRRISKL